MSSQLPRKIRPSRPANDDERRLVVGAEQQVGAGEHLEEEEADTDAVVGDPAGHALRPDPSSPKQLRSRRAPIRITRYRARRKPRIAAAKSNA